MTTLAILPHADPFAPTPEDILEDSQFTDAFRQTVPATFVLPHVVTVRTRSVAIGVRHGSVVQYADLSLDELRDLIKELRDTKAHVELQVEAMALMLDAELTRRVHEFRP